MPNITVTRQLNLNLVVSDVWTPILNLSTLSPYFVPLGGRSLLNSVRIQNQSANAVSVQLAISPSDTGVTPNRVVLVPTTVSAGDSMAVGECLVLPGSHALYVKAVGSGVDVTVSAPCLEYVIGVVEPAIQVPNFTVPYVAESWITVGTLDLSGYIFLMVRRNMSLDPGIYLLVDPSTPADGSTVIEDLVGNKFRLYQ